MTASQANKWILYSPDPSKKEILNWAYYGNMWSFFNKEGEVERLPVIKLTNSEFVSKLKIEDYNKNSSSVNFRVKIFDVTAAESQERIDLLEGCYCVMFMSDMMNLIQSDNLFKGETVYNHWIFHKKGSNYGIKKMEQGRIK